MKVIYENKVKASGIAVEEFKDAGMFIFIVKVSASTANFCVIGITQNIVNLSLNRLLNAKDIKGIIGNQRFNARRTHLPIIRRRITWSSKVVSCKAYLCIRFHFYT